MGVQDREWYQRSWDKKNQEYGGDFSLESQPKHNEIKKEKPSKKRKPQEITELSVYRTVRCRKCKEELYVHSPSKIDASGFAFQCNFCGAQNIIFEKGSSGKHIIKWLLAFAIILFLFISVLNTLSYFEYLPDDVLMHYPFLQFFVFL